MISKPFIRLLIVLAACIGLLRPDPTLAQGDSHLVLAFYYAWYDENTWTAGQVADQPTQPYASRNRATIERHVDQARSAGIDALIQSWYGPQEKNNQTESNFRTLLDVAADRDFRAAVDFEASSPFFPDQASVADALSYLLAAHAQHPAYLRYQGKPVVFFWREQRFSVEEWAAIRAQVDPNHDSLWIAEGVDIAYQEVFDGHHLYSIAWSSDVNGTLADWGFRVRRYESQNGAGRIWVATVMPGYDDTHTDRADAFSVDRRNGDYYRETWSAAIDSQADWIVITSFNEWVEGTMIEPSQSYGDFYLDLTRELVKGFKPGGEGLRVERAVPTSSVLNVVTFDEGTQTPTPVSPIIRADVAVRVRDGPGTDHSPVGRLSPGESAVVVGKNTAGSWWQIEFRGTSSGLGWVAAEFVTFEGNPAVVPITNGTTAAPDSASATPRPTATRTPKATPTVTPPPTESPAPTSTATPASAATVRPIDTSELGGSPTGSPTLTGTPMIRSVPVSQRRPVGLLWIGGGALIIAVGLGFVLLRAMRIKR